MLQLFKGQIPLFLEGATMAIYYAEPTALREIDDIQVSVLEQIGVSRTQALLEHNLVPLSIRREFWMLAILYTVSWRKAPVPIQKYFFLNTITLEGYWLALGEACAVGW